MSGEAKKGKPLNVSYTTAPTELQQAEPLQTASQFQNQQEFFFAQVERFKKMFEDSTLAKYIIMAGISGVIIAIVEAIRAFIDLFKYLAK